MAPRHAAMAAPAALALCAAAASAAPSKPHIFFVIVDDFGWAEVGYHRAADEQAQVSTATIDALVKEGVELDRHYVHMMCTPTRSSFQSGRLPVHVITRLAAPCDANGAIPRNMTGLAAKLKQAGYATHHVGKWDAGMATPHHTPKGRGYDTSLSYFGHGNWMWSQVEWGGGFKSKEDLRFPTEPCVGPNSSSAKCIRDFWDTDRPAKDLSGTGYEEFTFRDRMVRILDAHDQSRPLFLNYDSRVAHYPLQAPPEYQAKFSFIENDYRRTYHAMVAVLDDNLLNITGKMKSLGMWANTLMVLSSDNGGFVRAEGAGCNTTTGSGGGGSGDVGHGTACFSGEAGANNWPLRGGKYSPFEGGIRVNAFASGGFLPAAVRGTRLGGMLHIADWYGTFCNLAGVDPHDAWAAASGLPPVDSVDVWPMLSGANLTSPRGSILVREGLLVEGEREGHRWKLSVGKMIEAAWGGPQYPNASTAADPIVNYTLQCPRCNGTFFGGTHFNCCLFDTEADPSERDEVSAKYPAVVSRMAAEMARQETTVWSQDHATDKACSAAAVSKYGGFYGPWLEL